MQEFDPIIISEIEEAKGIWYEELTREGKKLIYQMRPNVKAATLLIEHTIGKPTENLDIMSAGEKIEGFTYIVPKNET